MFPVKLDGANVKAPVPEFVERNSSTPDADCSLTLDDARSIKSPVPASVT